MPKRNQFSTTFHIISFALVTACSSGTTVITPPPPPAPAYVIVTVDSGSRATYHPGHKVRLAALVEDASLDVIPSAAVQWSSLSPTYVGVGQDGRATILPSTSRGGNSFQVKALSGTVSATQTLNVIDWRRDTVTDAVTLKVRHLLSLRSEESSSVNLYLRCSDGLFEAYVSGTEITADGVVQYRLSGKNSVTTTWIESTDFKAVFAPTENAAFAFADQVPGTDSLFFRYNRIGGTSVSYTFLLANASSYYPAIGQPCR